MCRNKVPCSDPSGSGRVIYRSCGKCLDCLRQYQQDWTVRLSEECNAWAPDTVIFFTLTYADEHLPYLVSRCFDDGSVEQSLFRGTPPGSGFLFTRDLFHNTASFRKERKCFCDSFLDIPEVSRPCIVAPTVFYDDVNQWIRYCRKYFDRHVEKVVYKGREVSPYLRSLSWQSEKGGQVDFPACAYTPSFKYFITSEYGPGTLRPHYHGVIFGVPEDMFRDVFAPWWIEHFGREKDKKRCCEWSVYDSNKGGAMYISKYCSKGSFDHPLQSKVVRYKSGKEYVSTSYLRCLDWFGVDFPLVVPTFHLISKGIGVRYAFNVSVQKYWLSSCIPAGGSCVCRDTHVESVPLSFVHDLPVLKSLRFVERNPFSDLCLYMPESTRVANSQCILARCDCRTGKVLGESHFILTKDPSSFVLYKNLLFNKKHVRRYVYKGRNRTYSSILPRYYRRFLLSPLAQFALQDSFLERSESYFVEQRKQYRRLRQADQKEAFLSQIETDKVFLDVCRSSDAQERAGKFYSCQFKGDLI